MGPLCRFFLFSAFALVVVIEQNSGISIDRGKLQDTATCTSEFFKRNCGRTPYMECVVLAGEPTCVCKEGLQQNEKGFCEVMKKVRITIKIKKRNTRPKFALYRSDVCDLSSGDLRELKERFPDIDEATIKCDGDEITFEVYGKEALSELRKDCKGDDCQLGNEISLDRKAAQECCKVRLGYRMHQTCSKINQDVCEKLGKGCVGYDGTDVCVVHVPTWCTREKEDECRAYLRVCDDSNGIVQCIDPPNPEGDECSPEERENCWREQKDCEKKTGLVICKARSKAQTCSKKSQDVCEKLARKCIAYDGTDVCVDGTPKWCTREKQDECRKYFKLWDDSSGIPQCVERLKDASTDQHYAPVRREKTKATEDDVYTNAELSAT